MMGARRRSVTGGAVVAAPVSSPGSNLLFGSMARCSPDRHYQEKKSASNLSLSDNFNKNLSARFEVLGKIEKGLFVCIEMLTIFRKFR